MELFIDYYVSRAFCAANSLVFTVVETKTKREFSVVRYNNGVSWECNNCGYCACDHIQRAILYYANAEEMGELPESPAIVLDNPIRRIKVGA